MSDVGLSAVDYAAHRGCSDSYVRRLRRQGRVVLAADGGIDAVATDALLAATDDPTRGGVRGMGDGARDGAQGAAGADKVTEIDLREAMRRERLARARLAELELGEESGELVRAADVEREMFTLARQALERLRMMPSVLRHRLAASSDPQECQALIEAEIAKVCADLAQGVAPKVAALPQQATA